METVTLSLEKYEALTKRIEQLEKEAQGKTIYKEVMPEWWRMIAVAAIILGSVSFLTFFTLNY